MILQILLSISLLGAIKISPVSSNQDSVHKPSIRQSMEKAYEQFPGDGAHGENVRNVHDPKLFQDGAYTFCISTSGDGFGVMRRSTDMIHWEFLGPIVDNRPSWLNERIPHKSIWAPDIVKIGNVWRLYYCASVKFGENDSVIGLMQNDHFDPKNPQVGWVDKGLVIDSKPGRDSFNAIDPDVIVDTTGRQWMFFGSYWGGIQVIELNPKTGLLLHSDRSDQKCVARNLIDRGDALEGSAITYRDGYYYLFVSYGLAAQGVRSTYRIMVGRSKEVTGPFVDQQGMDMVDGGHVEMLKTSPPMFAPGHCEILHSENGAWYMVYHFYDGRKLWFGDLWGLPTLQIRQLFWSDQGWPLPGMPFEFLHDHDLRKTLPTAGTWLLQSNFGNPLNVKFLKDHSLQGSDVSGAWSEKSDRLYLDVTMNTYEKMSYKVELDLFYNGRYAVGRDKNGHVWRAIQEAR